MIITTILIVPFLLTLTYTYFVVYPVFSVLYKEKVMAYSPMAYIVVMAIPMFIISPTFIACVPFGMANSRLSLYVKIKSGALS